MPAVFDGGACQRVLGNRQSLVVDAFEVDHEMGVVVKPRNAFDGHELAFHLHFGPVQNVTLPAHISRLRLEAYIEIWAARLGLVGLLEQALRQLAPSQGEQSANP